MRPLRIEVTAFGPYAGTQVFDFAELGERRFFLIHGPTGAGKTTVLDALCFALYGDASGSARDGRGLRSGYAPPPLRTEATVDFALGGLRYRVRRSPAWDRPKKHGGGTTEEKATATLWRLDQDPEPHVLASGDKKVSAAVAGLLGFESDQFRQVVVLPQGEFRKFLLAEVGERETILEALFKTQRFSRVEWALKDAARELVKKRQTAEQGRTIVLEQAGVADREALDAKRAATTREGQAATVALELARANDERTREALDAGRRAQRALDERAQAQQALDTIAAKKSEIEAARQRLAAAQRAAPLVAQEAACRERRRGATKAAAAVVTTEQTLHDTSTALVEARARLLAEQQRTAEREAAETEVLRLAALEPKAASRTAAMAEVKQAERAHQAATDLFTQTSSDTREIETLIERLGAEESQARTDALEQRWQARQASQLAQALEDGAPCPVCGSREHPCKARAPEEPTADEPPADERSTRAAQAHLDALVTQLREARVRREQLATSRDAQEAATRETSAQVAAARARLTEREADLPAKLRAPKALAAALREATLRRDALANALERARDTLSTAERKEASAQAAAEAARASAGTASAARDSAQAALDAAIITAGFGTSDVWRAAVADAETIARLGDEVRAHEATFAAAVDRAARAHAAAEPFTAPDLTALEAAARETGTARELATSHVQACKGALERLDGAAEQLERFDQEHRELEARFAVVGRLAEVADGSNALKIGFQRYVLATLLDDVLITSTQRLREMSRGRYELVRHLRAEGRERKAGLALDVLDHHTGIARPVNTLSGGESFLASLCLALGLADVLQSYAGGLRLDTIFIDEGFGTLDQEALDLAIDTLMKLQGDGRLVGVISHVPELRERIDARLEILRGVRGSSARFVVD